MTRSVPALFALLVLGGSLAAQGIPRFGAGPARKAPFERGSARGETLLQQLPLTFERTGTIAGFTAQGAGANFYFESSEVRFRPSGGAHRPARLRFEGARAGVTPEGEVLSHPSYYRLGPDQKAWGEARPNYRRLRYREVWPGIDVVFYGQGRRLEFDFVLQPGARPEAIRMGVADARVAKGAAAGELRIGVGSSAFDLKRPLVYQETPSGRREIAASYRQGVRGEVGVTVAAHDPALPLIVDPVIEYAALFGGTGGEVVTATTVDAAGNAYVAGSTNSTDFSTTAGAYAPPNSLIALNALPNLNAYVMKLDATGTRVLWRTVFGGRSDDQPWAMAVDGEGNVTVVGQTLSNPFSVKLSANTEPAFMFFNGTFDKAFITKIIKDGADFEYSILLNGSGQEAAYGVGLDNTGAAYVAGQTTSRLPPTTPGVIQPGPAGQSDAFVCKIRSGRRDYCTNLGGSGTDAGIGITVLANGAVAVTGVTESISFPLNAPPRQTLGSFDVFVVRLNADASEVTWRNFLGGSSAEEPYQIVSDAAGNVYLSGVTASNQFTPLSRAAQPSFGGGTYDAFLASYSPTGAVRFSTYLGGEADDFGLALAVDRVTRAVYVAGATASSRFPTRLNSIQRTIAGGFDAFLAKFDGDAGTLTETTYWGGGLDDFAFGIGLDPSGGVYLGGYSSSTNLASTSRFFPEGKLPGGLDGFLIKIFDENLCQFSLVPTSTEFSATANAGRIDVRSASAGCGWSAATDVPWVRLESAAGSGARTSLGFTLQPNPTTVPRTGRIRLAGQSISFTQYPAGCFVNLFPSRAAIAASGDSRTLYVTNAFGGDCQWRAESDSDWVRLSRGEGRGPGTLTMTVGANGGDATRSARVRVGDSTITVAQMGSRCSFIVSSNSGVASMGGGGGEVLIYASDPQCAWTASAADSWIRLQTTKGEGTGFVRYTLDGLRDSREDLRIGTIRAAGEEVRVLQSNLPADPRGALPPSGAPAPGTAAKEGIRSAGLDCKVLDVNRVIDIARTGGRGVIEATVSGPANCDFFAQAHIPGWVSIGAGKRDGNKFTATAVVSENKGSLGRGTKVTVTVVSQSKPNEQTLDLRQDGLACSFSLTPSEDVRPSSGPQTATVTVVASDPACRWTAKSVTEWINLQGNTTQEGTGTVTVQINENTGGEQRSGQLVVNEEATLTITQLSKPLPPPCIVTASPVERRVPAAGVDNTIQVSVNPATCEWTVSPVDDWLSFPDILRGTGPRSLAFRALANAGGERTGTFVITSGESRQTISIIQGAGQPAACTYSLSPTSYPAPNGQSNGGFDVRTTDGCAWSATPSDAWITITEGASGTGAGRVSFQVTANTGDARNGNISAGGQTFRISQAAADAPPPPPPGESVLTLSPNPVQVCDGTGLGVMTVTWRVPGATRTEIRFRDGTIWTGAGESGSATTDKWVRDGLEFVLVDVSTGRAVEKLSQVARVTTAGCAPPAEIRFSVSPNPVQVCDASGLGSVRVDWSAPGNNQVEVRLNSTTGPVLRAGGPTGSFQTDLRDGSELLLMGGTRTLARVTVTHTRAGCPDVSRSGSISLSPNPITVCDGSGAGASTATWTTRGVTTVELRLDTPGGTLLTRAGATGSFTTGRVLRQGSRVLLQDVSDGRALNSDNTLAQATVSIVTDCAIGVPPPEGNLITTNNLEWSFEATIQPAGNNANLVYELSRNFAITPPAAWVASSTNANRIAAVYPSPFAVPRRVLDLSGVRFLEFNFLVLQGSPLAAGAPTLILRSGDATLTVTPAGNPPQSTPPNFTPYRIPISEAAGAIGGFRFSTSGAFRPENVRELRVIFDFARPGNTLILDNIRLVR